MHQSLARMPASTFLCRIAWISGLGALPPPLPIVQQVVWRPFYSRATDRTPAHSREEEEGGGGKPKPTA